MLDPKLHEAVLRLLPSEKQAVARRLLNLSLRFDGVSLSEDRSTVLLWDFRRKPVVVAKVQCDVLRVELKLPNISDDDCRLLSDRNQDVLAEIADTLLVDGRYADQDNLRIIDIGSANIERAASRISTTVLDMAAQARWLR
jgi:hypothetical protein